MPEISVWTLFFMMAAPAAGTHGRAGIPLTIDARGGIFVDVRIETAGPYRFVLDTGANRSVIADELAGEIGSPVIAQSDVVTSGGTELHPVVRLGAIALAEARVDGLIAAVVPTARLASLGPRVRGVLGQDFLSAFNYTLDYQHRRLTWHRASALSCDERSAVPLVRSQGRFVMRVTNASGAPLRLVPDSGAEVLVLFGNSAQIESSRQVLVSGISGARRAALGRLPKLLVGSMTLRDVPAVVVERQEPDADGLMPLHGFSSVSFVAGGACLVAER